MATLALVADDSMVQRAWSKELVRYLRGGVWGLLIRRILVVSATHPALRPSVCLAAQAACLLPRWDSSSGERTPETLSLSLSLFPIKICRMLPSFAG